MTGLRQKGIAAQAEWDSADAAQSSAQARIGEIRATIARKTIRAPFTGVLGIRQVNLGQYLQSGSPIVPLQSLDPIYVNFSVPQQDAAGMKNGSVVKVLAEGSGGRGDRQDHRDQFADRPRHAQRPDPGDASPTRTAG